MNVLLRTPVHMITHAIIQAAVQCIKSCSYRSGASDRNAMLRMDLLVQTNREATVTWTWTTWTQATLCQPSRLMVVVVM